MKQITFFTTCLVLVAVLMTTACGEGKKKNDAVAKKKEQLAALKKDQEKINAQIAAMEAEIIKLDPASAVVEKAKLVGTFPLSLENFDHFIDLQGRIEAFNVSYVAPKNGGGVVKNVLVKRGDFVKKGQLLLQLDNTLAKQNVAAAEKSLATLKTQLDFVKTIYQKQKALWDQNIGTEVQLITAKNNVDNLESQLATAKEQLKLAKDQLEFSNVTADMEGVLDDVNVRPGEAFTGVLGNAPQIKIVNTEDLKIVVEVPENYINKIHEGSMMKVNLPDIGKTIEAKITVSGNLIDANSRSFRVEAKIPHSNEFHPNQVALVNIKDYNNPKAITIPINALQNDEKGKYVMVAVSDGKKLVAKKKPVSIGELYGEKLEIKSGLEVGDILVSEGFQGIYEGQLLSAK